MEKNLFCKHSFLTYTPRDSKVGSGQRRLYPKFPVFTRAFVSDKGRSLQTKNLGSLLGSLPIFQSLTVYFTPRETPPVRGGVIQLQLWVRANLLLDACLLTALSERQGVRNLIIPPGYYFRFFASC